MSEWREIALGDVIETNQSSINREYTHSEILYLDTGSITCNRVNGLQQFELATAPSRAKRLVKDLDIIYSSVRPNQLHYGIIRNPQDNLVVSTGFVVITCKQDEIAPYFLYHYLSQNSTTEFLHSIAEGSTSAYPSLKPSDIEALEILLPPLDEQNSIASVLSSLDDKIDLLHRQNQTLEQMAETLYDAWFEESDFKSRVSDLIDLQNGYAFKSKSFQDFGEDRVLKIKNISGGIVDIETTDFVSHETVENMDEKFSISTGDILFAMTGAKIGKMGIIPKTDYKLWLNQRVGLFKEKYYGSRFLAYLHLKSDYGKDYIENTATGSAQPNISGTGIENCEFPEISEQEIIDYSNQLAPLYEKVIFNLGQIQKLEALRNTLLPKLMSGEIRIGTDE
jgi:type I restriction enzyme S subunit